jgi:hypothetical protein
MMKMPPQHNTKNQPGQIVHDKPLGKSIDEYKAEAAQKAVSEAFELGRRVGYEECKLEALKALDPSSEEAR